MFCCMLLRALNCLLFNEVNGAVIVRVAVAVALCDVWYTQCYAFARACACALVALLCCTMLCRAPCCAVLCNIVLHRACCVMHAFCLDIVSSVFRIKGLHT